MPKTRNFADVIRAKIKADPKLQLDMEWAREVQRLEVKLYRCQQRLRKAQKLLRAK